MRFWDSSALVPLLALERTSASLRELLDSDRGVCLWWAARTECLSGLYRRLREGNITGTDFEAARRRLLDLEGASSVAPPSEAIRARAERLLAVHPLRAADAFHLAAALVVAEDHPVDLPFVTLDDRLAEAARREGFSVLPR
ncbi:MAG: type II toxin-antitoxin system VapC family toxin [Acidithiobacillales bacterium]